MKKLICIVASSIFLTSGNLSALAASAASKDSGAATQTQGDSDADIVHVLNRISFGPKPGDIDHVKQIGIQKYIEEQLNPRSLTDPVESDPQYSQLKQNPMTLVQGFQEMRKKAQEFKKQEENADDMQKKAAKQQARQFYKQTEGMYKSAKIERALESQRQLQEVMTDFWYNHFNVYTNKGLDKVLCGPYEEQAIRPYVLGKFRDILGATCDHPAMLFYLDNWQNTAAMPTNELANLGPNQAQLNALQVKGKGKNKAAGLNENYARELMELHTLGVDGGYSQKDVTEFSSCFDRARARWSL